VNACLIGSLISGDKFVDMLSDLWEVLRDVLVVLLFVVAIIFCPPVAGLLGIAAVGGGSWFIAALLVTGAFLVDPETAGEVIDQIGEVVGTAGNAVAEVLGSVSGSVAGGFIQGIFSSPLGLVTLGIGFWFLFLRKNGTDEVVDLLSNSDTDTSEEEPFLLNSDTDSSEEKPSSDGPAQRFFPEYINRRGFT